MCLYERLFLLSIPGIIFDELPCFFFRYTPRRTCPSSKEMFILPILARVELIPRTDTKFLCSFLRKRVNVKQCWLKYQVFRKKLFPSLANMIVINNYLSIDASQILIISENRILLEFFFVFKVNIRMYTKK